ncbi:MAG: formylglycine-generating enzyme family protein [Kiritimatiellaceae bacterium]|nr:formylglycine-generating enzyme family protein [Kiritimatiellaceae bacterium]
MIATRMKKRVLIGVMTALALPLFGQNEVQFIRIVSPTNSRIIQFSPDGSLVWSNGALGITCIVQRASSISGPSNWVDYAQKVVITTNRVVTATLRDLSVPADVKLIPAGTFSMGDTRDNTSGEAPVHSGDVSGFYMGKTEVTKDQWDVVYNWAIEHGYTFDGFLTGKATNHPVQRVSWYDCVKWCNARSEKEGRTPCYTVNGDVYRTDQIDPECSWSADGYRLPTEAEWEKAARGGLSSKRFPWGDTIQHTKANYYSSSSLSSYDTSSTRSYHPTYSNNTSSPYTSPAGSFPTNSYGLYDLAGNVSEWCWDWYDGSYYASSPSSDPRGPSWGSYRVRRGGDYQSYADFSRVASRIVNAFPYDSRSTVGFRIALSAGP